LCITFELLSLNLYEFIKNNNFQGLSLGLIRRFAIQLLASLRYLKKHKIIHCDLKPENILLKASNKSGIKMIDFGSSCFEDERVYTYIQSRFYRSPEVILGLPYDVGIDMWSFGCILAELYTGYPLFPGENEVEQLACIMEVLGLPPKRMLEHSTRKKMFFDSNGQPRIQPNSRGKKRHPSTKDMMSAVKCSDPLFIDFLRCCLRWDPKQRYSPDDALQHQWILEATHPNPRQPLTLINKQGEAPLSQRHMRKTGLIGEIPKYKGGGSKGGGSGQTPRAADANSLFPRLVGGGSKFKGGTITIDGTLRKVVPKSSRWAGM